MEKKKHKLVITRQQEDVPYVAYHTAFRGVVVSADTPKEAVIELIKSIKVLFLYKLEKGDYSYVHVFKTEEQ